MRPDEKFLKKKEKVLDKKNFLLYNIKDLVNIS